MSRLIKRVDLICWICFTRIHLLEWRANGKRRVRLQRAAISKPQLNEMPAKTVTISNLSSTLTTSTNSRSNRRHAVPLMPGKHKFYAKKLNQVPSPSPYPWPWPWHIPSVKRTGVDHLVSRWGSFCLLPDCA